MDGNGIEVEEGGVCGLSDYLMKIDVIVLWHFEKR